MKRIIATFLFSVIGISIIGFFPLFKLVQYEHWQQVGGKINGEIPFHELTKIKFAKNDKIEWLRIGKELRYQNQVFDVVKYKTINDEIVYWCVEDDKENELISLLDAFLKREIEDENSSSEDDAQILLEKIFSELFFSEHLYAVLNFYELKKTHFNYQPDFSLIYLSIETPPPELT